MSGFPKLDISCHDIACGLSCCGGKDTRENQVVLHKQQATTTGKVQSPPIPPRVESYSSPPKKPIQAPPPPPTPAIFPFQEPREAEPPKYVPEEKKLPPLALPRLAPSQYPKVDENGPYNNPRTAEQKEPSDPSRYAHGSYY